MHFHRQKNGMAFAGSATNRANMARSAQIVPDLFISDVVQIFNQIKISKLDGIVTNVN